MPNSPSQNLGPLSLHSTSAAAPRAHTLTGTNPASRTDVMLSNRLGMARRADRALANGRLVKAEAHHQRLAGGCYALLFAAQAQWYR